MSVGTARYPLFRDRVKNHSFGCLRPETRSISPGGAMRLRIILFGLVGLTLFLAVYPYPVIEALGFSSSSNELAIRLFAGINAVLLTWVSVLSGRAMRTRNPHALSTRFAELDKLSSESKFPLPVCLIYDRYPSIGTEASDTIPLMEVIKLDPAAFHSTDISKLDCRRFRAGGSHVVRSGGDLLLRRRDEPGAGA